MRQLMLSQLPFLMDKGNKLCKLYCTELISDKEENKKKIVIII